MDQFVSWEISTKENKWQGRNITRWRNEEYDKAFRAAESELDPVKRAAQFIRMNDLVVGDQRGHPGGVPAARCGAGQLAAARCSGWDSDFWNLQDWYRDDVTLEPAIQPDQVIAMGTLSAAPADRDPEPARDQRHPVHGAGARAGRSVRGARDQSRTCRRKCARTCAPSSASTIRCRCATCAGSRDVAGRLGLLVRQPRRCRHADPAAPAGDAVRDRLVAAACAA